MISSFHWLLAAILLASASLPARAADETTEEIQRLRALIGELDQKLRVLERKQELKDEEAAAAAKSAPKVTLNDRGFTLASADGANSVRLRGLVQLDSRTFFGDEGVGRHAFVLRRARLISEGVLAKNYGFQFVTEFGGSSVSIIDANLTYNFSPALQLKVGKFKSPIGIELLQSDSWTFFTERSLATNLVPNRDLGLQLGGDVFGGKLNYAAGVFNGLPDGGSSSNADFDNSKEFAGRVLFSPFKDQESAWSGLSLGIAGSIGDQNTTAGRPAGYRTDGQQTFFSYAAPVVADGDTWRLSPQLDFRHGPFGLQGEFTRSTINVRPNVTGPAVELSNEAWNLAAGYVLTGEKSSYGGVVPASNFDPAAGTWGAWEVVARVSQLDVDDAAFPLFASPATNASRATSFGVGLNWYPAKAVAVKIDYFQTDFDLDVAAPPIPAALLQQDEQVFITRFQLGF